MSKLDRITIDQNIISGQVCIRGVRITVSSLFNLIVSGMTTDEIIVAYPYLEPDDSRRH